MALFDHSGNRKQNDAAVIVDTHTFSMVTSSQNLVFFGSGAAKCRELIQYKNARFIDDIYPQPMLWHQNPFSYTVIIFTRILLISSLII